MSEISHLQRHLQKLKELHATSIVERKGCGKCDYMWSKCDKCLTDPIADIIYRTEYLRESHNSLPKLIEALEKAVESLEYVEESVHRVICSCRHTGEWCKECEQSPECTKIRTALQEISTLFPIE